jgi:hypothetical protein
MDIDCKYEIGQHRFRCIITNITFNDSKKVHLREFKHEGSKQVQEVEIRDLRLQKFPRGLGCVFPKLRRLWIVNCGIEEISGRDFEDLPHLKRLNLKQNRIINLRSGVFDNLSGLTYLSLAGNFIRDVHPKVFQPLKNLDALNLQNNTSINAYWKDLGTENNRKVALEEIERKCSLLSATTKRSPPRASSNYRSNGDPDHKKFVIGPQPNGYLQPSFDDTRSIYIANVHRSVKQEDLHDLFRRYGHVSMVLIPYFNESPRGFAFVEFESRDSVQAALEQDDKFFKGCRIQVMRKRTRFVKWRGSDERRGLPSRYEDREERRDTPNRYADRQERREHPSRYEDRHERREDRSDVGKIT